VLEIGFHLMPSAWGKGLAREASLAVMRHAFEERRVPALLQAQCKLADFGCDILGYLRSNSDVLG
jgi:hypothetical protein